MKVSTYSLSALRQQLSTEGIYLRTGGFVVHIRSPIQSVVEGIALLYADYELESDTGFADFHVSLFPPATIRRWLRPQVKFYFDGVTPFKPLAIDQALPMLEWGLNWCVTSHTNQYLILHAAVVEKNGQAVVMPGSPGSGKSTLCAALVNRGWRLLSDELALISLQDIGLIPLPRPVSLKNESIDVISRFSPESMIGRVSHDTAKGSVAHMRVPENDIKRAHEKAKPAWVVFPKFNRDKPECLAPLSKGHALIRLIDNAFNYSILGKAGFSTSTRLIDQCDSYDYTYSSLDQAMTVFDALEKKCPS